jgi:hypothetical protein
MDGKRAWIHADLTFRDVRNRRDLRTTKELNLIGGHRNAQTIK